MRRMTTMAVMASVLAAVLTVAAGFVEKRDKAGCTIMSDAD